MSNDSYVPLVGDLIALIEGKIPYINASTFELTIDKHYVISRTYGNRHKVQVINDVGNTTSLFDDEFVLVSRADPIDKPTVKEISVLAGVIHG
jgi:hypothetical protein